MSKLDQLAELGQSVWLDFIQRGFMESGEMQDLIDIGLRGVTSNPSIFEEAISESDKYDGQLARLAEEGKSVEEIYQSVVVSDIRMACDLFRPVYDRTNGLDGYISLEVSPDLAHDTERTIEEVRSYWKRVDRPNLMIKIPATQEGYPAIQQMLSEGININITLMFSLQQYDAVAEAFLSGLEAYHKGGGDVARMASVASFFVSRVDTKVDQQLEQIGEEDLRGKIGIANAKLAYQRFQDVISGSRWQALEEAGARVQRVLWGSTSTKDPAYPDTMYVDNLIGPHTVNTIPRETLNAYLDHGKVARTVDQDVDEARQQIQALKGVGVDLDQVTDELLDEGVQKFSDSYRELLASIGEKCAKLAPDTPAGEKISA